MTLLQHSHVTAIVKFLAQGRDSPRHIALVHWQAAHDLHEVAFAGNIFFCLRVYSIRISGARFVQGGLAGIQHRTHLHRCTIASHFISPVTCLQEQCFKCVLLPDVGMFAFELSIADTTIYNVANRCRFSW